MQQHFDEMEDSTNSTDEIPRRERGIFPDPS